MYLSRSRLRAGELSIKSLATDTKLKTRLMNDCRDRTNDARECSGHYYCAALDLNLSFLFLFFVLFFFLYAL